MMIIRTQDWGGSGQDDTNGWGTGDGWGGSK